ncbi:transcriptional repressor DicA [Anaerotignum neopropionicum]|uniref:Transcriptional repressor DicA n=1 Tax=Anaerotignum neopropionicum TaxID=36847 RepID=A0A136WE81_9FIRM|nr:helix-turn-helix transcriptional regulator [Anaerotignum neopropionicum]KXL52825.1 transcriptional repressor DicA [Anaerotignum neopropionicum]
MIGDCIKIARKNAGMTQEDLGKAIGMSGVAIMRYEKGQREPNKNVVEKIAKALGVNPNFLMDWDEQYPDIAIEVEKHERFVSYMKSLGFDVVYYSEPCTIPIEAVPKEFKDEVQGSSVESETFSVSIMYEGDPLTLTEDEFSELQKQTAESIEHQLWKFKKIQENER